MRLAATSILFAGLALAALPTVAEDDGVANYAYAVFVGTGEYRISDRTIYVIRAPMSFNLREADFEKRTTGWRLLIPVAVGLTNYKEFADIPELSVDNLHTISLAPGVEVVIPVMANWQISPFGQAGMGIDLRSNDNSFIWGTGTRSRAWFGEDEKWLVGGELLWAGNHPTASDEPDTSFVRWAVGTEYKLQTDWQPFGHRVSWHARLIRHWYTNAVEFEPPRDKTVVVHSTEVGVSFGIDPPINIFGYKFRQGGIGFEQADGLKAIKLFTTFPF